MDPLTTLGWLVAALVLLGCSAFFSSAEIAMFSLPQTWAESSTSTDHKNTAALTELLDNPHRLLVTVLVGNNLVNIAIASIMSVVLIAFFPPGVVVVVSTILTSVMVLMIGEIIPKSYGLANAEQWALLVAPAIRIIELLLYPIIVVMDVVTRKAAVILTIESNIEKPYLD